MMTQERIDYFLNLPKGQITDEEFEELKRDYFQSEKEDWYELIELRDSPIKVWKEEKVEVFWKLIWQHAMPYFKRRQKYSFDLYIFPEYKDYYTYKFWGQNEKNQFEYPVSFYRSEFLGFVSIWGCDFLSKVSFRQSKFFEKFYFGAAVFEGDVNFDEVDFSKEVTIKYVRFNKEVSFKYTLFEQIAVFESIVFEGTASFEALNIPISYGQSIEVKSPPKKYNLEPSKDIKLTPILKFDNIDFTTKVKLSRFNVSKLIFVSCDITYLYFNLCNWQETIRNTRLIFSHMEEVNKNLFKDEREPFQNSENQYRQLKQNFTNIGNWELAGYAYVSEMEMRKKRFWQEKNYLTWLFYWFYDYFGGYTQDFVKPVKRLFFVFLIFTGIYYFIDFDISNAFQRSIAASVPYIEIQDHVSFQGEWLILKNIQFVLSVVLLSFFVLALRKRFKL